MIDVVSALAGSAILLAGMLVGRALVSRPRRVDRGPMCGCTHSLATHDPETGKCADMVLRKYESPKGNTTEWRPCPCQHYIGPEYITGDTWVPPVHDKEK